MNLSQQSQEFDHKDLFKAISEEDYEKVKHILQLLKDGSINFNIHEKDRADREPLLAFMMIYNAYNPIYSDIAIDIIRLFIENGADLNFLIKKNLKLNPLALANDTRALKLLLDNRADPYMIILNSKNLLTFLGMDIPRSNTKIKFLIEYGVDPNIEDSSKMTVLMEAVNYNNADMVDFLLENNANPNKKDKKGRTSLMLASDNNNLEIVQMLLKKGAKVNIKDSEGRTAYDYTTNDDIKRVLREHEDRMRDIYARSLGSRMPSGQDVQNKIAQIFVWF